MYKVDIPENASFMDESVNIIKVNDSINATTMANVQEKTVM